MSREGEPAMKTILFLALALAVAAVILALSSAQAAMLRQIPDLTAITPAPVVAVATKPGVNRRAAVIEDTETAD